MTSSVTLAGGVTLAAMNPQYAAFLSPALAAIEPWSRINYPAASFQAFLTAQDPALSRHAVRVGGETAGLIAIRKPWLRGPYLQLLALLPPFQGQGIGATLLHYFEQQADPRDRWAWLCYSTFNSRAGAFYARRGYEEMATLPDLVLDGTAEILMRKRINAAG
jgi:GNAT superfamily N-acetyltransferase